MSFIKLNAVFYVVLQTVLSLRDPYAILNVARSASQPEIKQAYKHFAKEWHPDKNKDPEAESKFIEIIKAYELLMDPERRRLFDRSGITEDIPHFHHYPDYSQFGEFDSDPFDNIFSYDGFSYHKYTITAKSYENYVLPNSNFQPYLVLFYGEGCFPCHKYEPTWQKLIQTLEPLGMGFAAIEVFQDLALSHKIGVTIIPYLIGVVSGSPVHNRDQLSLKKVLEFCRKIIPSQSIISLTDYTVNEFLEGWHDNRIRVLIFSKSKSIRLRYLLLAFRFQSYAAIGHIKLENKDTKVITKRYNVQPNMESLLIFNEDISKPIATLRRNDLPAQTMNNVIEANKFLIMPRLSSQALFDQLCPNEVIRVRKNLCVIFVTQNTTEHDSYRTAMRAVIQQMDLPNNRVKFMYIYQEKQKEFIEALSMGAPEDPIFHGVVIRRKEYDRVQYLWLDRHWGKSEVVINSIQEEVNSVVNRFMRNTKILLFDTKVSVLADEHAPQQEHVFSRVLKQIVQFSDVLWENVIQPNIFPSVCIVLFVCIFLMILIGFKMLILSKLKKQIKQEKCSREIKQVLGMPNRSKPEYQLHIHEFCRETYSGLVRFLKPGCRALILLLDNESKMVLLPIFRRAVYPYRKHKKLMLAFLMIENNFEWYKCLLLQTLGNNHELNINPKNYIGTVLSINGYRKYFCVYKIKHSEQSMKRKGEKGRNADYATIDSFIRFEKTDSDNNDVKFSKSDTFYSNDIGGNIIFQERSLDDFSNWLDRLFKGSTQKYYIHHWPDNI